ncbi:cobalamin-dependent protein [Streptomyces sp. NPDC051582]|uniref:cobalamin B12-binding domain-containing protein n=1 Tax=Streptomyces sp. NPDC051582 TaxID=3155167 RepID=UPI0034248349
MISTKRRLRTLVSGLSSDAHMWNLVYLQLLLEDRGHQVSNLGSTTPDAEILRACRTERPDLLVISSVNGHGRLDGLRLIRALRAVPALRGLPVVIGGKLGVDGGPGVDGKLGAGGRDHASATTARLTAAGYDAVFDDAAEGGPEAGLLRFEAFLAALAARSDGRPLTRSAAGPGAAA